MVQRKEEGMSRDWDRQEEEGLSHRKGNRAELGAKAKQMEEEQRDSDRAKEPHEGGIADKMSETAAARSYSAEITTADLAHPREGAEDVAARHPPHEPNQMRFSRSEARAASPSCHED